METSIPDYLKVDLIAHSVHQDQLEVNEIDWDEYVSIHRTIHHNTPKRGQPVCEKCVEELIIQSQSTNN